MTLRQGTTRRPFFTLLTVGALLVSACSSTLTNGSGTGGTSAGSITIAIGAEPTTLDPQATDDGSERAINDNIYDTLVWRDGQTSTLGPGLALSWELTNPTTWRFKLRPNVKFTNGEVFDAAAVVFSVKRIIDPAFKSPQTSYLASIVDAKAVDDTTVDIITNGPDPILPSRMTWMKMVPPVYAQTPDFASKPVGTGPYKFVSWRKGQDITLTANPDYWGGASTIKDVTIRIIPETLTALQALKAGEIDLMRNLDPELTSQAPMTASTSSIEFYEFYIGNTTTGPFKDVAVRQAANYAIDKQGLLDSLFGGHGTVAQGQILRKDWLGFNPNLQPYPYDPAKAKELLAGRTPEIKLVGETGRWLKSKETVEAVGGMLQAVGFKVNVEILEFNAWLSVLFLPNGQKVDAIFASTSGDLLDADRSMTQLACPSKQTDWCDQKYTDIVSQARTETDPAKRNALYAQATQLQYDAAPLLYLVNPDDIYGLSARLNWKPRLDGKLVVREMSFGQ